MSCCAKVKDETIWRQGRTITRRVKATIARPIIKAGDYLQHSFARARRQRNPANGYTLMEMISAIDWEGYKDIAHPGWAKGTQQVLLSSMRTELRRQTAKTLVNKEVLEADLAREFALQWVMTRGTQSINGLTSTTRQAIIEIVTEGIRNEMTMKEMAAAVHDTIGLSPRDAKFIAKRKAQLERNGAPQKAITRQIKGLRKNKLKRRAELIAATESFAARNQGQVNAWKILEQEGRLNPGMGKEWIAFPGCPICAAIVARGPIPLGDLFYAELQGTHHDAPPAHPGCQCSMGIARLSTEQSPFSV